MVITNVKEAGDPGLGARLPQAKLSGAQSIARGGDLEGTAGLRWLKVVTFRAA